MNVWYRYDIWSCYYRVIFPLGHFIKYQWVKHQEHPQGGSNQNLPLTSSFAAFRSSRFHCSRLFSVWFGVSAAGCRSCLTAIRGKNKASVSGQHKYAYFCRLSQLLRIPAAKIARYGCERRDVECLQNALISAPPPPNTLVNLKSAMSGSVRPAV